MMVDLGGGARERFQNVSVEEPEDALPPLSSVGYTHPEARSASWRTTQQVSSIIEFLSKWSLLTFFQLCFWVNLSLTCELMLLCSVYLSC